MIVAHVSCESPDDVPAQVPLVSAFTAFIPWPA